MPKLSRIQKKRIAVFCAAALAAWVIGMIPKTLSYWHNTSSILYLGILIAWALTVRRRVVQVDIRRLLTVASALMVSLFLARRCRYDYFGHSPAVMRYLWYAYYNDELFHSTYSDAEDSLGEYYDTQYGSEDPFGYNMPGANASIVITFTVTGLID